MLREQPRTLILHMAGIRLIDEAAARMIADATLLLPAAARMVIRCPSRPVHTLLHRTGLDTTLHVEA